MSTSTTRMSIPARQEVTEPPGETPSSAIPSIRFYIRAKFWIANGHILARSAKGNTAHWRDLVRIAGTRASWQAEYEDWKNRSLADPEAVYLWVHGVSVKAGLEKEKAAMLVVLAARPASAEPGGVAVRGGAAANRRLDAPELIADAARDEAHVNGVRAVPRRDEKAAAPDLIYTLLDKTPGVSYEFREHPGEKV